MLLRNATGSWPVMKWWRRKDFQYIFNKTALDVFFNEKAVGGARYSDKIDLYKYVLHAMCSFSPNNMSPRMFLDHMDEVHAKLTALGMENESADSILKRYKEIGLPNWWVLLPP